MLKQVLFLLALLVTLGVFTYTTLRLAALFRLTKKTKPIKNIGQRIKRTLAVAFGQTRILRKPVLGMMHALVFWGFCLILIGSLDMLIDGLFGTHRVLQFLGPVYDVIIASGDIFAFLIFLIIIAFLIMRIFMNIRRFSGAEMTHQSHRDANIALTLILLLMLSLLGMNTFYYLESVNSFHGLAGLYPVSKVLSTMFTGFSLTHIHTLHEVNWWTHILLIFIFANYLPYSKHFHVFMSIPNVFLSNLDPLGKLTNMESITKEVKMMLDPNAAFDESTEEEVSRFGVLDAEDVSWKNYLDALACTQCGRCTDVCPANITGKKLSPRKIVMDLRSRMKEKGPGLIKHGKEYTDEKSLIRDYISPEELWACTTCNACARECPININHPALIIDMRRYLVMEESAAPSELNAIFSNIENNGAPWQFSQEDRMAWADDLFMNKKN